MNDTVTMRIIPPPGGGLKLWNGTRFVLADGTELPNVVRCVISPIELDCIATAELTLAINLEEPIEVQPLLDLATVLAAAERHGYTLVEKKP